MQDFLLLLILLATFIFGWFLMKKVDILLEEWQMEQTGQHETEGHGIMKQNDETDAGREPDGTAKTKSGSALAVNQ